MTIALIILAVLIAIWVLRSVWKTLTTVDETPPPNGGYDAPVWRKSEEVPVNAPSKIPAADAAEVEFKLSGAEWPIKLSKDVSLSFNGDKGSALSLLEGMLKTQEGFLTTAHKVADALVWSQLSSPEVETYRIELVQEIEKRLKRHLKTSKYRVDSVEPQDEDTKDKFDDAISVIEDEIAETGKSFPVMRSIKEILTSPVDCPLELIQKVGFREHHIFLLERFSSLFDKPEILTAGQIYSLEPLRERGIVLGPTQIPNELLLSAYTVEQLEEALGTKPKRKAEFANFLDESNRRLLPSFASLRMLAPLTPEMLTVVAHYRWAIVHAKLLTSTVRTAANTERVKLSEGRELRAMRRDGLDAGWAISGDCCAKSRRLSKRGRITLKSGLPPFHIGCEAELYLD